MVTLKLGISIEEPKPGRNVVRKRKIRKQIIRTVKTKMMVMSLKKKQGIEEKRNPRKTKIKRVTQLPKILVEKVLMEKAQVEVMDKNRTLTITFLYM